MGCTYNGRYLRLRQGEVDTRRVTIRKMSADTKTKPKTPNTPRHLRHWHSARPFQQWTRLPTCPFQWQTRASGQTQDHRSLGRTTAAGRFHILKFKANLGAGNLAGRQIQGKGDAESGCTQEVNTVSSVSSLASVKGWNKGQQHCTVVRLWLTP